jgi:hypothetical protein
MHLFDAEGLYHFYKKNATVANGRRSKIKFVSTINRAILTMRNYKNQTRETCQIQIGRLSSRGSIMILQRIQTCLARLI